MVVLPDPETPIRMMIIAYSVLPWQVEKASVWRVAADSGRLQLFNDCLQSKIAIGHCMSPHPSLLKGLQMMTGYGSCVQASGCFTPYTALPAACLRNASITKGDDASSYTRYVT